MQWGFTIVELLVVITIIVILLALLSPALDRAVYQAELATCAARLKGVATSATVYAMDFSRRYPRRQAVAIGDMAHRLSIGVSGDDRKVLAGRFDLDALGDPMSRAVDIAGAYAATSIYTSYSMRFGWYWNGGAAGVEKGMHRLGDRFEFTAPDGQRFAYSYLAHDRIRHQGQTHVITTHPDNAGRLVNEHQENKPYNALPGDWTLSRWAGFVGETAREPAVDMNFAREDGSVERIEAVVNEDDRMVRVPSFGNWTQYTAVNYTDGNGWWDSMPVR